LARRRAKSFNPVELEFKFCSGDSEFVPGSICESYDEDLFLLTTAMWLFLLCKSRLLCRKA
jgi:hypothetical protein